MRRRVASIVEECRLVENHAPSPHAPRYLDTAAGRIFLAQQIGEHGSQQVSSSRCYGFTVTAADSGVAIREILAAEATLKVDAILLDHLMPGEPSAQLALHAKSLSLPVVMISGSHDATLRKTTFSFSPSPFGSDLLRAISEAVGSGEFGQRGARMGWKVWAGVRCRVSAFRRSTRP
jgi:CheY-like chemotaxis protein